MNRGRTYWGGAPLVPGHENEKIRYERGDRRDREGFRRLVCLATLQHCSGITASLSTPEGTSANMSADDAAVWGALYEKREKLLQAAAPEMLAEVSSQKMLQEDDEAAAAMKLLQRLRTSFRMWDAVVDFSAFDAADAECVVAGLRDAARIGGILEPDGYPRPLYVYISSDSVYEVTAEWAATTTPAALDWDADDEFASVELVSERHAVRPLEKKERKRLKRKDGYGDGKLQVEEALKGVFENDNFFPFSVINLRLPDVIGPYDDTGRLWAYWLWLTLGQVVRLHSEGADADQQIGFVYSKDVGRFVGEWLSRGGRSSSSRFFHTLNFGCKEQAPLGDQIKMFREETIQALENNITATATLENYAPDRLLRVKHLLDRAKKSSILVRSPGEHSRSPQFFPSVERVRALSFSTLNELYPWFETSGVREAYRASAEFFLEAMDRFPDDAKDTIRKLPRPARLAAAKFWLRGGGTVSSSESSSSSSSSDEDMDKHRRDEDL